MGWTNQVVIASEVIIAGYPDVLLVYDGPPAAGNLIASIAAIAAVDPYGNAYTGGIWVYGTASTIGMEIDGGVAYLILGPVGLSHSTAAPNLFAVGRNIGLANEYLQLTLASGKESGNDDAALQLFSETADGTGPAQVIIELGGFIAATFARAGITEDVPVTNTSGTTSAPSTITNGSWTAATSFGSGWAASGSGVSGVWFRVGTDGNVYWIADVHTTTATPSQTICTIPAAFEPSAAVIAAGPLVPTGGTTAFAITAFTAGQFEMAQVPATSGVRYAGGGWYPLNGV